MYCPGCGIEETQANQFCRSCGTDLRTVRTALSRPDQITEAGAIARRDISLAIADRIRAMSSAEDLSTVAEEVLPQIEKFLESPAERRLRRIRVGMILSSIGAGAAFGISLVTIFLGEWDLLIIAGLGIVCFFLGLGFILNGMYLTLPRTSLPDGSSSNESQPELDSENDPPSDLNFPEAKALFPSVTEHTTKSLDRER
ncbi:MAG: hypothetical protein KF831_04290 [Acidobacteria bacterium]|nr:hypothetical protein [Acidobacteriota bacterium]